MNYNYSIYYSNWHNDSVEHADGMSSYMWQKYKEKASGNLDEAILDIGCGYGFLLRAFQKAGYRNVCGLEISEQQAAVARRHGLLVHTTPNTVEWLLKRRSSFDLITLVDVLEHVERNQQIELLEAIKNSLTPGGRLLIEVPNANSVVSNRWRYNDWTHYTSFTEHSLKFVLQSSGFLDVSIDTPELLPRIPKRFWGNDGRGALRKWLVRWLWLQVYKAELPHEKIENISFELNLVAVARA